MTDDPNTSGTGEKRGWFEDIEVAGEELLSRVKQLATDNRVKRIRVVEPDGDIALEIPLTYGAIAGGAVVLAAPVLAVLGTLGAFAARLKIEIVQEDLADEAEDLASEDIA